MRRHIDSAEAMEQLGRTLASASAAGDRLYIQGDLGAGKTTLVRGFLHGLGHSDRVTSPTYALVEPYELPEGCVVHADLYRLTDPAELENLGIREWFDGDSRCLVEWPERAAGRLGEPDLYLAINIVDAGRDVSGRACSARGQQWLGALAGTGEAGSNP